MYRSITQTYRTRFEAVRDELAGAGDDVLPLTGAQRRFHHAQCMQPESRRTVVCLFAEFPAATVSAELLRRAAEAVVRRNPALRSRVDSYAGVPLQRIVEVNVSVREVSGHDARKVVRAALDEWPGDAGPFQLVLGRDTHTDLLALAFDHIVCDETSIGQVVAQLTEAYGADVDVPDRVVVDGMDRYRDAIHTQLDRELGASGEEALVHWLSRLRDAHTGRWAVGRRADEGAASRSDWRTVALPTVRGRGQLFPTLLASCRAALVEHDDTAPVCYTWAGGREAGPESVMGCFINTVVCCPPGDGFQAVQHAWWDDLEWADTPFDEVVRAARQAKLRWSGHLDLVLTLDDRSQRTIPVLGGVAGKETYVPGMRVGAPMIVSASYDRHELNLRVDHNPALVPDDMADHISGAIVDAVRKRFHASA